MNIGIDIGSTASKVVVYDKEKDEIVYKILMPSGWNSKETSVEIYKNLVENGYDVDNSFVVATGYGRVSVPYADRVVTEITTHSKGAIYLKDIRILNWFGSPQQYMDQVQSLVPLLTTSVANYLSNTPIYTLDERNSRDAMIKKVAKGIRIEQGRLEVDTLENAFGH